MDSKPQNEPDIQHIQKSLSTGRSEDSNRHWKLNTHLTLAISLPYMVL